MANKPSKPTESIIPIFSENADIQKALETRYLADQEIIKGHFGKLTALKSLNGLNSTGWGFTVSEIVFQHKKELEENGYQEPIGELNIILMLDGARENIAIQSNKDGDFGIVDPGQMVGLSKNPKRIDHHIEGWRLEMEELYNFDCTAAMRKKEMASDKTAKGGPRPEAK